MAKFTFLYFLRDRFSAVAPVVSADLSGRNVLITGANTGIGLEAVKHFATMNPARLIIGCRDEEKGQEALDTIARTTGYSNTTLWLVDLNNFSSVVAFADRFEAEEVKLNIVVANAAILHIDHAASPDGLEQSLQVNYLSTVLLSLLLLPRMEAAASDGTFKPRLVLVTSEAHFWTKIPQKVVSSPNMLKAMNDEEYCKSGAMFSRYFETKRKLSLLWAIVLVLVIFFAHALTSRLSPNSPILVNTVHPGYCKSGLTRHFKFPMSLLNAIGEVLFARNCEQGSRNLIWAAIGVPSTPTGKEDDEGVNLLRGAYIVHAQVKECSDYALSEEGRAVCERFWDETIEILTEVSPKVRAIVQNLHSV